MPKALCLASLVVAALVLLLFLADLIMLFAAPSAAPLGGASMVMDIAFIIFAGIVGYLGWSTYKEQV